MAESKKYYVTSILREKLAAKENERDIVSETVEEALTKMKR
jgi:hypothetical protein